MSLQETDIDYLYKTYNKRKTDESTFDRKTIHKITDILQKIPFFDNILKSRGFISMKNLVKKIEINYYKSGAKLLLQDFENCSFKVLLLGKVEEKCGENSSEIKCKTICFFAEFKDANYVVEKKNIIRN